MLNKLNEAISSVLPPDVGEEVKKNIEGILRSNLEKMDLVTREQLDIQRKVLDRTRKRVQILETKVKQLEASLAAKSISASNRR